MTGSLGKVSQGNKILRVGNKLWEVNRKSTVNKDKVVKQIEAFAFSIGKSF